MLRILPRILGARHARLGGGHFQLGLPWRAEMRQPQMPLSPRRQPQMPLYPRRQPQMSRQPQMPDLEMETFIMADVAPKMTGLPMIVYVSIKYANHGPRIKMSKEYGIKQIAGYWFYITVADEPCVIGGNTGGIKSQDVKLVKRWIAMNRDVLIRFWDQVENFDASDMLSSIKKI